MNKCLLEELIILNNHPVPLICHLPQVTIINEPGYPSLGDCRNRLLELATGEYVRTWDDDDLYLPTAKSPARKKSSRNTGTSPTEHRWNQSGGQSQNPVTSSRRGTKRKQKADSFQLLDVRSQETE